MNNIDLCFGRGIKRVALIYPITGLMPPLGLITLAASLENAGMEVIVVSMFDFLYSPEMEMSQSSLARISEFNPDMCGIGFMSADWKAAKVIIEHLSKSNADSIIMAGGRHPSAFPEEVLGWGADFVVVGEGETATTDFINALPEGYDALKEVEGLAFYDKENDYCFKPREKETANLDIVPAYHLLPYQSFINTRASITGRYLKSGCLSTSRGCFSKCIYCRDPNFGKHLRFRSMDSIFDDICFQLDNYDLDAFYIIDDMFAMRESRVIEFCKRFQDIQNEYGKKLLFAATARTDKLTASMVDAMKNAGCTQLSIGVESGSQRILDFLGTGKKADTVVPAFNMLKNTGIDTFVNFIIGVPGETEEDIQMTMDLVKQIDISTVSVTYLTPYPGTPLFDIAVKNGWIDENNLDSLVFKHSHSKPHLESGIPFYVLESHKKAIFKLTFKKTLSNVLHRREGIELVIDLIKSAFNNPRQVFHLGRCLLGRDVDAFKVGLQLLLFSNAH